MSSTMTTDSMGVPQLTPYAWPANSGTIRVWTNITSPEVTAPLPRLPEPPAERQIPARELLAREGVPLPTPEPRWIAWVLLLAAVLLVLAASVGIEAIRAAVYTPVVSPDVPVETLVRGAVR